MHDSYVTPIHKEDSRESETNCRHVSILSNVLTHPRFMKNACKQISEFFENILSKYQCGFRNGFSSQQCLLVMIEKWRKRLDKGASFGVLLADL